MLRADKFDPPKTRAATRSSKRTSKTLPATLAHSNSRPDSAAHIATQSLADKSSRNNPVAQAHAIADQSSRQFLGSEYSRSNTNARSQSATAPMQRVEAQPSSTEFDGACMQRLIVDQMEVSKKEAWFQMKTYVDELNPSTARREQMKTLLDALPDNREFHYYEDIVAELWDIILTPTDIRPMEFSDQQMVPSSKDLEQNHATLTTLMNEKGLTPSQAWAIVAASKKSTPQKEQNMAAAKQRLQELNREYRTTYTDDDLPAILEQLRTQPIVTNYHFESAPGSNIAASSDPTPLYELMMNSTTFKNVWETGVSQAAADTSKRGAIEEQMGYGLAVNRTSGNYGEGSGSFTPRATKAIAADGQDDQSITTGPSEMPKYAALVSPKQKHGVAKRYGNSFIVWKESVRSRVTHTPGDSWSGWGAPKGVSNYGSNSDPESLFLHAESLLLRLTAGDATDYAKDPEFKELFSRKSGIDFEGYIETQIHGELTWNDVAEIVIGWGKIERPGGIGEGHVTVSDLDKVGANEIKKSFEAFARRKNYDFSVRLKQE